MLTEGGPKFRGLEEGEELYQSFISKHLVLLDQWGQDFQIFFFFFNVARKGNFEGLGLALSQVNGEGTWWHLSHVGKDGSLY